MPTRRQHHGGGVGFRPVDRRGGAIKVLIVEPGAFRTGFAGGGALLQSPPNPAYDDIVGPFRQNLPATDGKQPGDDS